METIQITPSQNKDSVSDEMMKTIEFYTESQDEFPVDFDEFWQWCGYARKDNAKRVLEKNFTEDVDFNLRQVAEVQKEGNREVKRPTNKIRLTNDCAKAFAMLAETSKGRVSSLLPKSWGINATKAGEASLLFQTEVKKKPRCLMATHFKETFCYISENQTFNHLSF